MTWVNLTWLLPALLIVPVAYLARRKERIRVASTRLHTSTLSSRFVYRLPLLAQALAVILAAVALCQPLLPVDDKTGLTVQGRDIIMALDWSGSMAEEYKGERLVEKRSAWYDGAGSKPNRQAPDQEEESRLRRIDAAQDAILTFAETRRLAETGDHIALVVFDHKPVLRWPLDRDLKQIARHGSFLPVGKGPQQLGVGTNFGNEMPGPIDLAAEHFQKKGKSSTRVLILVTDGEDEIKPDVMTRLSDVIAKARMKLYVIGVGEKIGKGELTLERLCRQVGGEVFRAESQADLDQCFARINALESSPIPVLQDKFYEPLFHIPLLLALLFYVLGILCEAVILGR